MIPKQFIEDLTLRADIYDVVSRYVALKKMGANYFGLCPFHTEKTASFSVSTSKQIYHCFSCGKGGGVINFIMQVENLDYVEAIHFLANIYNLEVPETNDDEFVKRRSVLYEISKTAARFYYDTLMKDENQFARQYLLDRRLSKKIINNFGIGYSEDKWTSLLDFLTSKGYKTEDIFAAGLIVANKNGGYYDRFRGRIMFPIIDVRGNVIAFGARVLDNSLPKYINSSESLIYSKSKNLFGLNIARKTKADYLILAEGYMDVIALHQAGFDMAVASLGTSLTAEQANIIKRQKSKVVIAYDADDAGQKATKRAIEILNKEDIEIKVLNMGDYKDPDEYIKEKGSVAFENLLEKSENDMDYQILSLLNKYDIKDDEGKIQYISSVTDILAKNPSSVQREVYAGKAAKLVNISTTAIMTEVDRKIKNRVNKFKRDEKKKILAPVNLVQPKERSFAYKDTKSALAEENILQIIFEDNSLIKYIKGKISKDDFSSEILGELFDLCMENHENGSIVSISSFEGVLDQSKLEHLVYVLSKPVSRINLEKTVDEAISVIKQREVLRNKDINLNDLFNKKKELWRN